MAPYEESIHVPLYVAGPGIAAGEITRMVGLHDVAPTLIQLAGGQAPSNMDGKPLGAFLTTGSDGADPKRRTARSPSTTREESMPASIPAAR